ncbi:PTC1, partial [Symbiodinium necroappetens]
MNLSCSIASILSAFGLLGFIGVGYHYRPSFLNQVVGDDAEWPTKEWHETWHKSMGDRWMCKQKCAEDEECMSKCPKPWIHMEEMCTEVFDIVIRCHQGCGDDMNCHRTCPLPKCPKMAAKVKGIIQCNIDCGSDDACRDACNAPVRSFRQMCGRLSTSGICHKNCGQDRVCHKQCPRVFPGKAFVKPDFAGMQPPPAQMASTFRSCQASCAGDADCIEKCPKPFWLGFRKICQEEVTPISECHRNCGHDDECHAECPFPSCPHMKAMVETANKCHERCGPDRECHYHCPTPLMDLQMRCQALEEAQQCHDACREEEGECHHLCPKAGIWKFWHRGLDHGFHHGFQHEEGVHHDHHHHHGFHHGFHHDEGFHHEHDHGFHGFHAFHGHHGHWHHFHHESATEQDPTNLFLRGSQLQEQVITCTHKCQSDTGCLEKCTKSWWELKKSCTEVVGMLSSSRSQRVSRKMQHIGMLSSDPPPITCDGRDAAVLPKGRAGDLDDSLEELMASLRPPPITRPASDGGAATGGALAVLQAALLPCSEPPSRGQSPGPRHQDGKADRRFPPRKPSELGSICSPSNGRGTAQRRGDRTPSVSRIPSSPVASSPCESRGRPSPTASPPRQSASAMPLRHSPIFPSAEKAKALWPRPARRTAFVSSASDANSEFRPYMEDGHQVVQPLHRAGSADMEELWDFFGVYDGHGGRAEVDHVEAHLHGTVRSELLAAGDAPTALVAAFKKMDSQLAMMGAWNSGCTATVALVIQQGLSRIAHVANVGDSRAVLVSPTGDSRRVSRDHRASDPDEARRVSEEGGFVRFGRVGGALSVSRSLGDHNLKGAGVSCIPDIFSFPVNDGEALLVASDGFWDALSD